MIERTNVDKSNMVHKPDHYCKGRRFEPLEVAFDWDLDFALGSALKYIARAGRKDDIIQDLMKAKQYLEFEIEYLSLNKIDAEGNN